MITDQTIKEVYNFKSMLQKDNKPFSRLSPKGKWDDIVTYDFKCNYCNDFFHLSVETYHGSGGELKRIGPKIHYDEYGNTET